MNPSAAATGVGRIAIKANTTATTDNPKVMRSFI
jgi:hypothetical protein